MMHYRGINCHINTPLSMPNTSTVAIYGRADATIAPNAHKIAGVYGYANKPSNSSIFSAGVVGIAQSNGGVGVYGGINGIPATLPASSKYAGYFDGPVYANGRMLASSISIVTDQAHIDNVRKLSNRLDINRLASLCPVVYTLAPDTARHEDNTKEKERLHYGLVAQEVQKVMPEIVYENEGCMSVNYLELIPLLIKTVQDLSAKVEEQDKQIKALQTSK